MNTNNEEEWEDEEILEPAHVSAELLSERYKHSQLKIVRTSVDYSTDQLLLMIRDNQINMSPLYQRRNRWDQTQKSRLIESLLLNIPIPPLFLYESDYGTYEVMDGRQRLESLYDFLSNRLRLKGMEYWSELEGMTYEDLPKVFQLGLRRRTVGAIILLAESDDKISTENDVRMILFERLNTGGVRLNPQELRNALYQGAFNNMVVELSTNPLFRILWEIPREDDPKLSANTLYASMGDCDLVLRFFAILEFIRGRRIGSLRKLMDGCAKENQFLPSYQINELRSEFIHALEVAFSLFGEKCFRLPNTDRLSKSLYDASMVAITLQYGRPPLSKSDIASRLEEASRRPESYAVLVGRANTSQAIRDRVNLLVSVIFGDRDE